MRTNKRRGKKKPQNRDENQDRNAGDKKGYKDIVRENASFEAYYKVQKIVSEEEWDTFMSTLRNELPVAFRITGSRAEAKALLEIIQSHYFSGLLKLPDEENPVKPFPLPWYPDKLAWQMKLSRVTIRRSEHLTHLHKFLVSETESGNISRQETVSMIPPLLLGVEPHHKVLDMCASPGSKSAQIIEMLHKEEGKIPTGFLVANDVDNKRCYMLVHQAKRLHSPCIVITNHNAAQMPNLTVTSENGEPTKVLYDRILCDVPCSGDGTLRKNIDVWEKWNVGNGNNLHNLQIMLVQRGLELLAPGGRLVYSTCSLNPAEDEAVVAASLQMAKGNVSLVDAKDLLPDLRSTPGLSTWTVMSRDLQQFNKWSEVPEKLVTQIRPTMFPPEENLNLHRCLRILPHQQDTGGFFVAVLEKHTEFPSNEPLPEPPPKKRKYYWGHKEDPYIFLTEDDPTWPLIRDSYSLSPEFPHCQLLSRCKEGKARNLYYVTKSVKDLVERNADHVKIINTGVRVFSRSDAKNAKCSFRMTQEGMPTLLPYYNGPRVELPAEDMGAILTNEYPTMDMFSAETQAKMEELESGCVVIFHNTPHCQVVLCSWKGQNSLRCYVPRQERPHYLRICGLPHLIPMIPKGGKDSVTAETKEEATEETKEEMEVDDPEGEPTTEDAPLPSTD
ncbi:NSUN2 [Cordylochernes scorpioides]|uniref:tRNA (cytosine(34)-C(5))-methyltransferase n=1 Tax=Cordylochernes scorpioides TaxID=51811 RepID=A0ABY6JZG2_9ARAC|nr:NSUN2 [Cordylochernes scorpioides]